MSVRNTIQTLIDQHRVESVLTRGSKANEEIRALQPLLYQLGFGEALNWEKYGADGHFGKSTAAAVELFAQLENIDIPAGRVTNQLVERIIGKMAGFFGAEWGMEKAPSAPPTTSANLTIREVVERGKTRVYVSDGTDEARFTRFKKGIYTMGKQKAIDTINRNQSALQGMGLTDSAINVMVAVSENEGNLDAINTWDNSFMTFGMFQWTIGAGNDPGELAALLAKIKTADPDAFQAYYGQYGLDIQSVNNIAGYFVLAGQKLVSPTQKERLRTYEWAFYFWKSGQESLVQTIQIQHALSRIGTFYKSDSYKPNGYYISDLITSEYGVGLILDNHVNRPGYVKPCLEEAMKRANLADPVTWGTPEEMRLIEIYLKVRADYGRSPMTHADKRASVTKKYLDNGTISAERGSFRLEL
jgi:peptidoglycan hydrolase-like protein with peptidoglycan-binding domain